MTIFHRIIYAGTAGLPEKEKLAVKTTNRDAAATGIMVFTFGGIINYLFPLMPFLIAVILEGTAFYCIVYLNYRRQYKHAKMGMYLIHCASATYFGSILGEAMPIEMIASFLFVYLIGSSCLVYRDWRSRNFFIMATVVLWVVVYLNRYFRFIQPAHFPEHVLPIVAGLCTTGMLVLMFFTAITLIKQSDRLTKEAEAINEFKTKFVHETTHDLRIPLNSIVGNGAFLKQREAELSLLDNGEEILKEIKGINAAAKTMTEMINNQLDMAMIEAGKFYTTTTSIFNVMNLVAECISQNQVVAYQRGVSIKLEADIALPWINGDEIFMVKIINNLLSNAVKFTDPETEVLMSVKAAEKQMILSFKNTANLSPEKAKQIFTDYQSERNKIAGTGLGLSITRHLVTLLKGTITVATEDPEHPDFQVCIPYDPAKIVIESADKPQIMLFPGLKVLVVEDDAMSEYLIKKILKGAKTEVISFSKVTEAIKSLRSFQPDIIISDWNLGEVGGRELIQYLKDQYIATPVIVASAEHFPKLLTEMMQAGAAAIVHKPIIESDLYRTISLCMHQYHLIA